MDSFSQLLKKSWNIIFHDTKSFWIVFFLVGIFPIGMVILSFVIELLTPYASAIGSTIIGNPFLIIATIICGIVAIVVFVAAVFYPSFLGMSYLTYIYKKKTTPVSIFSDTRFLPYLGTSILSGVSIAGVVVILLIGFLLLGSAYLAFITMSGYADTFMANMIGGALTIILFIVFAVIVIFCSFALVFSISAFFLDDIRYFASIRSSLEIIKGRWWQTFGYIFCLLVMIAACAWTLTGVALAIPALLRQPGLNIWIDFFFGLVSSGVQVMGQLFYFTFLLNLYDAYKKHPIKK